MQRTSGLNTSYHLPWALVIAAVFWSWHLNVLAHETCNNEQRYENQVMCEGKQFGCLVPYPDNCSLFLVCDCLYPTVKLCPANLWWDNNTQLCNYPQAVECVYYSIETPEPTDGTTKITPGSTEGTTKISPTSTASTPSINWPTSSWDPPPLPPGISEDACRDKEDGRLLRYPYDCQAYINCTNGWPVLNYCDPDKVFNDFLKICDTPEMADCEELPLPTTSTELTPTSTTEEDIICGPTPEDIAEDYCVTLGNGFYDYPYNCSGYLACRNGCTDLDYCQPDKLFNSWLHICDTPDSVQCDPEPYPTTPGITEKPTTPATPTTISTTTSEENDTEASTATATEEIPTTTPGLPADVNPNECKGLPDGTIIAYAGNCSQYLICKDNQVEMGECPPTLLFNPDWLVCDEPGDFTCLGDRTTTPIPTTKPTTTTEQTTPTPTTTTTKATTLGPSELCEGQPLGTSFAYPEDCSKYYLCMGTGGEWLVASCIFGSYFDPQSGICAPNVSPDACKGVEATTPATTVTPTTTEKITTLKPTTEETSTTQKMTTTTEAPSTGVCAGRNENENIAYPKNCNKYIVCVSPIPIAFYCPDETFFSSKLGECIGSWEESDCEGDQSTTTPEPGITRPPPEPTMCTNSTRDTFPYPDNCQWFIRCVDDYIYMMDVCNCGEYYDPITGKCGADVPSDACRWDYTSTTSTTEEPTTSSPVTRPPPQKGPCDSVDDDALVPYPNDCSKYIQCSRPIAEAFDCDEGDEFSVALKQCVDASLANCSVTTTAKPSEATTTSSGGDSTSTSGESTSPYPPTPTTKTTTISSTESTTKPSTVTPTESTTISTSEPSTVSSTVEPIETSTLPTTESSTTASTETPPESTTISTTYEPESSSIEPGTTTTAKPGDGVCGGKTDNSSVPYPRNCSKYIICQYPIPVGYDCPIGLEFSPTELICMDPELAGCSTKLTTTEEPTTAGSTTPSTTESTTLSTTELTTPKTTSEATTVSTTTESTTPKTTSESTTVSTTPKTTTESTTISTTTEPTTPNTSSESTTVSTTAKTTTESTTVSTTAAPPITLDPYTPNICCGQPLGTLLAYPNDCSRYVVCDYPIPYAVDCDEGTIFDDKLLQCTATPNERCLFLSL
nr:mucin-2 [Drosophila kikkawai]